MEYVARPTNRLLKFLDRIPVLGAVLQHPLGILGFIIVLLFVIITIFAPWIAPYSYVKQDFTAVFQPPGQAHFLGTDNLGRDIFSRIIFGSRIAMSAALPSVAIGLSAGLLLGLISGYLGGWVDNIIVVLLDSIQAFPSLVLALAILAVLGPSLTNVIIVIGFALVPGYARVARSQVSSVKHNDYIQAENNLGASTGRLITMHILPNIIAPLVILVSMDLPVVITFEAGLSFLGLGVRPPSPSWGVILSDGFKYIFNSPWPVLSASLTLMIVTLGFTLFGETLRDVLDPRLSGTEGS
jgi:peptide/nickel transport system permease protein